MSQSPVFSDADLVYAYSRAQALADGVLVDASALAKEAGFKVPVALTAAAWADCVAWDQARESYPQDETGRLWDVLTMARFAARGQPSAQRVNVELLRVPSQGHCPQQVRLVMVIGPGDQAEPVITIMQPGED